MGKRVKNRAKCRLCASIIESVNVHDYVECKCGEIAIDGGDDYHKTYARSYDNFLRVDDEGNEVVVKVVDKEEPSPLQPDVKPNRDQLIEMLNQMELSIERLPEHAKTSFITQYDYAALISLLHMILKAKE